MTVENMEKGLVMAREIHRLKNELSSWRKVTPKPSNFIWIAIENEMVFVPCTIYEKIKRIAVDELEIRLEALEHEFAAL